MICAYLIIWVVPDYVWQAGCETFVWLAQSQGASRMPLLAAVCA